MELVKCNNLCKKFDNKQVLNNINLSIPKGKIIGLLGKNGMGKTTLIKLINDLLTPTSGEVLINGEKPGVNSKKIISYLPERTYLDKNMNVSQIITFFNEFYDNFNEEKAIKLLKDLDLDINLKINDGWMIRLPRELPLRGLPSGRGSDPGQMPGWRSEPGRGREPEPQERPCWAAHRSH